MHNRKGYKDNNFISSVNKMRIIYDKEVDIMSIELNDKVFAKNKKIDDFTMLDLDKKGKIIGIELLNASKRMPKKSLSKVYIKNLIPMAQ